METLHICIIALCMMPSTPYSPLCWNMCTHHLRYTGLHLDHISTNHSILSCFLCKNKHQEECVALPTPPCTCRDYTAVLCPTHSRPETQHDIGQLLMEVTSLYMVHGFHFQQSGWFNGNQSFQGLYTATFTPLDQPSSDEMLLECLCQVACFRSPFGHKPFSLVAHPPAVPIKSTLDTSELQLGALSCHQRTNMTAVAQPLPHFSPKPQPQQGRELQEPTGALLPRHAPTHETEPQASLQLLSVSAPLTELSSELFTLRSNWICLSLLHVCLVKPNSSYTYDGGECKGDTS